MTESVIAIDIGGTSIKFSLWQGTTLGPVKRFPTPATLDEFYAVTAAGVAAVRGATAPAGIAISAPGAVNQASGVIEGDSTIPYLHGFDFRAALTQRFKLPVTLENDANCAALAEMQDGAGAGLHSALFVVIGTDVGGAVVLNDRIWHGAHLYGGEFGYMLMKPQASLGQLVAPVSIAKRYLEATGERVSGEEVFARASKRDTTAMRLVAEAEAVLGKVLFNLQQAFDPERIMIGGAISANAKFIECVQAAAEAVQAEVKAATITPTIVPCAYRGEANLRGAVVNFYQQQ